ncbi:MAG: c-type cytochrome [Chromatiaceae bacterium]|nr:c-type cytochrome [Gammaproteobacteria bacterium]MCP5312383.1 c-type cytochrome [Chromatiaceae bacterium]
MGCKKKALAALIGSVFMGATTLVVADPSAIMMANTCAGCHGTEGQSVGPASPNLAGISESYFIDSMKGFKEGTRAATIMDRIAKGYSDAQIESMAGYFAGLPVYKAKTMYDAAKAKAGAEVYDKGCAKCHDENGALPSDDAGILAGQWLPYLQYSMADFQGDHREMPKKMKKQVEKLSDAEIEAVLNYFASQQ